MISLVDCKEYKVTATVECIIKSDDENLDFDVMDWLWVDDDCDGFIKGFKIIEYDYKELKKV